MLDQLLALSNLLNRNRLVAVPPTIQTKPLTFGDRLERPNEIAAAQLLVIEAKLDTRFLRVILAPTNGDLEQNTFYCFEFHESYELRR